MPTDWFVNRRNRQSPRSPSLNLDITGFHKPLPPRWLPACATSFYRRYHGSMIHSLGSNTFAAPSSSQKRHSRSRGSCVTVALPSSWRCHHYRNIFIIGAPSPRRLNQSRFHSLAKIRSRRLGKSPFPPPSQTQFLPEIQEIVPLHLGKTATSS